MKKRKPEIDVSGIYMTNGSQGNCSQSYIALRTAREPENAKNVKPFDVANRQ